MGRGEAPAPPAYVFEQIRWERPRGGGGHDLDAMIRDNLGSLPVGGGGNAFAPHNVQFFAGGAYSGAPEHFHAHALNALVAGRKRWLLSPPPSAAYSATPAASTLDAPGDASLAPPGAAYQCVQDAGDLLYVPAGWGHAVLNLPQADFTSGVALEFHEKGDLTWSFEDRAADLVAADRRL